ncbi:MAG: SPOR domain-containing protein [Saprospiraceae bacterium]|nr:SPOR domain-containing protein [Saprospiraceae bacterium]
MNRILKILFLAIVFFMGYLWFGQIFKSCNKPKSDIGQYATDMEESQELPASDFFEDDSLDGIEEAVDQNADSGEKPNGKNEPIDYNKLDEIIDNKNQMAGSSEKEEKPTVVSQPSTPAKAAEKTETKAAPSPAVSYETSGSDFMVIAGSYLVESNANEMVQTLKKMGFSGAEKVVFDLSKFYSVSAGRYPDHEAASKAASKLKTNGIDCYVHKKK